jgi:2,3-bisphosphoglycerate-independent phosphoglycerate mutase
VGLGAPDPAVNPFAAARTPFLASLLGGQLTARRQPIATPDLLFRPLSATLSHGGLPQSATGQATLLTGLNGADIMAGHYGPWPGPTLKRTLSGGTLFSEVVASGGQVVFANAFPDGYFRALAAGKQRVNVPVYAAQEAGIPLLTQADYDAGRAVSADLDGSYLGTPQLLGEAGAQLVRLSGNADLTFFDFWLSDSAGHRWTFADAVALVEKLDAFLAGLVSALGETTLLLTSDHGNLEDKTTRSHTRNPVPLLAVGPQAAFFAEANSLLDVAPALRRALTL